MPLLRGRLERLLLCSVIAGCVGIQLAIVEPNDSVRPNIITKMRNHVLLAKDMPVKYSAAQKYCSGLRDFYGSCVPRNIRFSFNKIFMRGDASVRVSDIGVGNVGLSTVPINNGSAKNNSDIMRWCLSKIFCLERNIPSVHFDPAISWVVDKHVSPQLTLGRVSQMRKLKISSFAQRIGGTLKLPCENTNKSCGESGNCGAVVIKEFKDFNQDEWREMIGGAIFVVGLAVELAYFWSRRN